MRKTRIKVLELNDKTIQYYPQYRAKFNLREWASWDLDAILLGICFFPIVLLIMLDDIYSWKSTHELLWQNHQVGILNQYGIISSESYSNIEHAKKAVDVAIRELKQREDDKIKEKQEKIAQKVKKKTIVKYP